MLFNFESFPGFSAEDFLAFEERKWSSNRFNLERMKARAKLDSLRKELESRLRDDIEGLVFNTTLDHPHIFNRNRVNCLWLYLDRPEDERTELTRIVDRDLSLRVRVEDSVPQHHVAIVGVGIDGEGASLFFRLHSNALLDRRNLSARLADLTERQHLLVLFSRLPGEFRMSFAGDDLPLPSKSDDFSTVLGRLDSGSDWLTLERGFDRDDPVVCSPELLDVVTELLPPLLRIWRFSAWSRDNDRLKLAKHLKQERKQKARRLTGFEEGDAVVVTSGLLSGKRGTVVSVDLKGRVKAQFGRVTIDMDSKLLRRA